MYPDIGNLKNASVLYGRKVDEDLILGKGRIFAVHLKETRPGAYRDMLFGEIGGHTEYDSCLDVLCADGVRLFTGEFWCHGEVAYTENIRNASTFLRAKIENALKKLK